MRFRLRVTAVVALCTTALWLRPAGAQVAPRHWTPLPGLGGDSEDRVRLGHLFGTPGSDRFLLRAPSDALDSLPGAPRRFRWIALTPDVAVVDNSAITFSLNDGALWAGRGWSNLLRTGLRAQWGRVSLVLAPELVSTENLPYAMPLSDVQLARPPGRSPFSTPWHVGDYSIDLPLRFGDRGFSRLDFGQSSLAVDAGSVVVGLSTENEWWGPGIRNAIVLSNNAAGIWRAFARTRQPVRTRVGTFAARWF